MVCLEEFYDETGMSRVLFGDVIGLSTSTLKKYERSNTDHMRKTSIEKIEEGVEAVYAKAVHVTHHAFSKWPYPRWTVEHSEGVTDTRTYEQLVNWVRSLITR